MQELFPDPAAWQRLYAGPLRSYIGDYFEFLLAQGYARPTLVSKMRVVGKLSRWMEKREFSPNALDEELVENFVQELHRSEHRRYHGDRKTLRVLLEHLRHIGAVPAQVAEAEDSEQARFGRDFRRYLTEERALSTSTQYNYINVINQFLDDRFGAGPYAWAELGASDITQFVLSQASRLNSKRAQLMTSALRNLFRYLLLQGKINMDLATVVPTVAQWRLSELPKYLEADEVERLLQSCDQGAATQQRDYSVLLLIARLGLRAGEVVQLCLDDIDWHSGLLTVRGKGDNTARLPLPADVGEAIATYLRHGRPVCASRRVFVRSRAPQEGFASSVAIDSIMRRALKRAELNPVRKGAHLLRHSLATRMLREGASLMEIGQILRHRQMQTTEIYAKVDENALAALAQPWPGVLV